MSDFDSRPENNVGVNRNASPDQFILKAKAAVVTDYNRILTEYPAGSRPRLLSIRDVYVVWFSKTLQNWKALLSTTRPDGLYYEVTHHGDKAETYVDTYQKVSNLAISDEELDNYIEIDGVQAAYAREAAFNPSKKLKYDPISGRTTSEDFADPTAGPLSAEAFGHNLQGD